MNPGIQDFFQRKSISERFLTTNKHTLDWSLLAEPVKSLSRLQIELSGCKTKNWSNNVPEIGFKAVCKALEAPK